MIPAAFDYLRPASVDEVSLALTQSAPGEVTLLAGGQSLLTRLKLRQARPKTVVDLGGVAELRQLHAADDLLTVGAMVTQAELLSHPFVRERLPLLAQAGAAAGDPMVRNLGTLAGAICEADPAGDWAAAALALDAVLHLKGPDGSRRLPVHEFITAPGGAAFRPGELVTAVGLKAEPPGARSLYRKRKHHGVGWSVASLALSLAADAEGRCVHARVAISGVAAYPQRLPGVERALLGMELTRPEGLEPVVADVFDPAQTRSDRWASGEYRLQMLKVLLRRSLAEIVSSPPQPTA